MEEAAIFFDAKADASSSVDDGLLFDAGEGDVVEGEGEGENADATAVAAAAPLSNGVDHARMETMAASAAVEATEEEVAPASAGRILIDDLADEQTFPAAEAFASGVGKVEHPVRGYIALAVIVAIMAGVLAMLHPAGLL